MIVLQIATKPLRYWMLLTLMLARGKKKAMRFLEGLYRWEPAQLSPFTLSKLWVAISRLVTVLAKTLVTSCYRQKISDSQFQFSLPCFRPRLICLKKIWVAQAIIHNRKINEADSLCFRQWMKQLKEQEQRNVYKQLL